MPTSEFQLSIYDQMRKNRWRTVYLFVAFPVIVIGLIYLAFIIIDLLSEKEYARPIQFANEATQTIGFWIIIAVLIWSVISYFIGSKMILAFAGAKPIAKSENPELYRVVENASIAAGLPKTPDIYIIDDMSLNAFATGTSPKNAKVAISKGLLSKLEKAELEAVMAHEIGHIINRDIRVMLISVAIVGAIQMIGEIMLRSGRGSDKKGNVLPLIGFLFITIGVILGTLTRLAISRQREYLADTTSANLTSNPNALASALEKIAQDARIEILDKKDSLSCLCIADPTASGDNENKRQLKMGATTTPQTTSTWQKLWSTHPPIMDRIRRLRGY